MAKFDNSVIMRYEMDMLLDALRCTVSYNRLKERLQDIKTWPIIHPNHPEIKCIFRKDDTSDDKQFEVLWMILVYIYGDWGTSPRWGWIDDIEGAYSFIDLLCDNDHLSELLFDTEDKDGQVES